MKPNSPGTLQGRLTEAKAPRPAPGLIGEEVGPGLIGQALRKVSFNDFWRLTQMSVNLPQHYVREYATVLQLLLQQKGSKLRPFVTTGMYVGDQASPVDQIDSVEMQQVTTRF